MKKIPYGIADYKRIKDENYYFVDKTPFIEKLENLNEPYMMFLRPRRFGKSLLISYLAYYYDIFYKDSDMFSDTYIGKNPTKEIHSFYVLRFNFSAISIEGVEDRFQFYINLKLESFVDKYNLEIKFKSENIKDRLEQIFEYFNKNRLKLYIFIDEYDHFANRLLLQNKDEYQNIITKKDSFFKEFFTILKSATDTENSPLKRMFITGVTPMTMYDVTSGFNIGSNISLRDDFHNLVGFNEDEVEELLNYYDVKIDKSILKEWYNNYVFSSSMPEPIYNTDMILYFINQYKINNKIPEEMIDINVRSDYSKLRNIVYTNKKLNGNFEILRTLIAGESISINNLVQDFSALNLIQTNNFKSLLFYLGLITIKERKFKLELKIPNETVKRIDIEFLDSTLQIEKLFKLNIDKLEEKLANFALEGDIEVFKYLAEIIKESSGLRDYIYKEQHIKAMYLAYLSITPYYIVKSEYELNKGFADLFIKPFNNPYVKYLGLVEFKYINKTEKADEKKIAKLVQEATEQLNQYENDEVVTKYTKQNITLKKVVLVFHGYELVYCEEI